MSPESAVRVRNMLDRADRLVASFAARADHEYRRRRFDGSRYVRLCFAHKRALTLQDRMETLAINLVYDAPSRLPQ